MIEYLPLFKSIHIIGFVAWFGGLFYLVRILVYHEEAFSKPENEKDILSRQYQLMEMRVYRIICNPGMMITWTFGVLMLVAYGAEWLGSNGWMHIKLLLLVILTAYHLYCKKLIKDLKQEKRRHNSFQIRLLNEVPSIFLVAIVLLAVYRNMLDFGIAFISVVLLMVLILLFAKMYKRQRSK